MKYVFQTWQAVEQLFMHTVRQALVTGHFKHPQLQRHCAEQTTPQIVKRVLFHLKRHQRLTAMQFAELYAPPYEQDVKNSPIIAFELYKFRSLYYVFVIHRGEQYSANTAFQVLMQHQNELDFTHLSLISHLKKLSFVRWEQLLGAAENFPSAVRKTFQLHLLSALFSQYETGQERQVEQWIVRFFPLMRVDLMEKERVLIAYMKLILAHRQQHHYSVLRLAKMLRKKERLFNYAVELTVEYPNVLPTAQLIESGGVIQTFYDVLLQAYVALEKWQEAWKLLKKEEAATNATLYRWFHNQITDEQLYEEVSQQQLSGEKWLYYCAVLTAVNLQQKAVVLQNICARTALFV